MSYPDVTKETEICVAVRREGVTLYGNRAAFRSLSRWLSWIADSDPKEHFECHLLWNFNSYESKVGEEPPRVWVLYDKETASTFQHQPDECEFEVTFMAVERSDLDKLREYRESRMLPEEP